MVETLVRRSRERSSNGSLSSCSCCLVPRPQLRESLLPIQYLESCCCWIEEFEADEERKVIASISMNPISIWDFSILHRLSGRLE